MSSPSSKGNRRGRRTGDRAAAGDPPLAPAAASPTAAGKEAAELLADVASPVRGRWPAASLPWEAGSPRHTSYREQLRATGQQALQDSRTQANGAGSGPPSPVRRFRAPPPSPAGVVGIGGEAPGRAYGQNSYAPGGAPQLPIQPRQLGGAQDMSPILGAMPMPMMDSSPMMAFAMPQVIDNEQLAEILRAAAAENQCYED